jgi:hypothetical protein
MGILEWIGEQDVFDVLFFVIVIMAILVVING